jgi:hypothetical protein
MCYVILAGPVLAQETDTTVTYGWEHSLDAGLGFTQTKFENYAKGGESSLTWTSFLAYKAIELGRKHEWKSEAETQFGQTQLGDGDVRKAVDRIRLASLNTWKLGEAVDPYVGIEARTQFAKGYAYPTGGGEVLVSKFLNPLELTQRLGGSRTLGPGFVTRLGVAFNEYIVTDTYYAAIDSPGVNMRYTDDPTTAKREKFRLDTGMESVTDYERSFESDRYKVKSSLKLFSKFEDPSKVKVEWTSKFTANLISFVNVMLETEVLYDEDILKRTQLKETFSIGLSKTFF